MLGKIRKLIHTANRPLAQICRRMHEMDNIKKFNFTQSSLIIFKEKKNNRNDRIILKIKYKQFIFTTKMPDNVVLLKNNSIIQITNFHHNKEQNILQVGGNIWNKIKSMYSYPIKSKNLQEWILEPTVSSTTILCDINNIFFKIIIIPIIKTDDNNVKEIIYASALLHDVEN